LLLFAYFEAGELTGFLFSQKSSKKSLFKNHKNKNENENERKCFLISDDLKNNIRGKNKIRGTYVQFYFGWRKLYACSISYLIIEEM